MSRRTDPLLDIQSEKARAAKILEAISGKSVVKLTPEWHAARRQTPSFDRRFTGAYQGHLSREDGRTPTQSEETKKVNEAKRNELRKRNIELRNRFEASTKPEAWLLRKLGRTRGRRWISDWLGAGLNFRSSTLDMVEAALGQLDGTEREETF